MRPPMTADRRMSTGLDQFQREAIQTAVYPGRGEAVGRMYAVIGLAGETGEVSELIKKMWRNHGGELTLERREKILDELGDVLWYAALVADECDISLGASAVHCLEKLAKRKAEGKLKSHGSSSD